MNMFQKCNIMASSCISELFFSKPCDTYFCFITSSHICISFLLQMQTYFNEKLVIDMCP